MLSKLVKSPKSRIWMRFILLVLLAFGAACIAIYEIELDAFAWSHFGQKSVVSSASFWNIANTSKSSLSKTTVSLTTSVGSSVAGRRQITTKFPSIFRSETLTTKSIVSSRSTAAPTRSRTSANISTTLHYSESAYLDEVRNASAKCDDVPDLCPFPPPALLGNFNPNKTVPKDWREVEERYANVSLGGHWRPLNCTSRWKIVVIVPFRNRDLQLRVFLNVIHEFLQRQLIEYRIFVAEQTNATAWNKGMLYNAAFYSILTTVSPSFTMQDLALTVNAILNKDQGQFDFEVPASVAQSVKTFKQKFGCVIFHDVDLLPQDDRNIYSCPALAPRHLSMNIDAWRRTVLFPWNFGGAVALTVEQFLRVNGFSNRYFNWGWEDDDLSRRVRQFWNISSYPFEIAKYTSERSLGHVAAPMNRNNYKVLQAWSPRCKVDGLNSLFVEQLSIVKVDQRRLYTRILIDIREVVNERQLETIGKNIKIAFGEP